MKKNQSNKLKLASLMLESKKKREMRAAVFLIEYRKT